MNVVPAIHNKGQVWKAVKDLNLEADYESLLYLLYLRGRYYITWADIKRYSDVCYMLTNSRPRVTYYKVRRLFDHLCRSLQPVLVSHCGVCMRRKVLAHVICRNRICRGMIVKKSTLSENKTFTRFNLVSQAERILDKYGRQISTERLIHHLLPGFQFHSSDDIRSRDVFTDELESMQDFVDHHIIHLPVVVHFDGTKYDKKSKSHDWQITIGLCDIDPEHRFRLENVVFLGIYSGYSKPKPVVWEKLMRYNKQQWNILKHVGVQKRIGGVVFTFRFRFVFPLTDLEALSIGFNFIARGYHACPLCKVRGEYSNGSVRYPLVSGAQRTRLESLANCLLGRFGCKGGAFFQLMIGVEKYIPDSLHTFEEGIAKDFLQDLLGKGPNLRRPTLHLPDDLVKEADKLASILKHATYGMGRLRTVSDCAGSVNAKERRGAYFMQLPIVLAHSPLVCCESECWILAFFLNQRKLMDRNTTQETLEEVCAIIERLAKLYTKLFGSGWNTIKLHIYLVHYGRSCLKFGNPVDFDTTPFEGILGVLKRDGSVHATNNYLLSSFERLHVWATVKDELSLRQHPFESEPLNDILEENGNRKGARGGERVSHTVVIPLRSQLTAAQLVGDQHYQDLIAAYPGISPLCRLLWRGQALAVRRYWDRAATTEQSLICFEMNGRFHYGEVQSIGRKVDNGIRLLVSCFETESAFTSLRNRLNQVGTQRGVECLNLFEDCLYNNQYLRRVQVNLPRYSAFVAIDDVETLCSMCVFRGTSYIVTIPPRCMYA